MNTVWQKMKTTSQPHDSAAVVQRQLDAYNARDVDALLATYADDAQTFEIVDRAANPSQAPGTVPTGRDPCGS